MSIVKITVSGQPGAAHRPARRAHRSSKGGDDERIYSFELGGGPSASPRLSNRSRCCMRDGPASVPVSVERPDVASAFPDVAASERAGFWGAVGALSVTGVRCPAPARLETGQRELLGKRSASGRRLEATTSVRAAADGHDPGKAVHMARPPSQVPSADSRFRPFKYENAVATYWATVLQELSEPNSYLSPFSPGLAVRRWWLGDAGVDPE